MRLTPFDPANYINTPEDLRYYLEAMADPFDAEHYARSIDSVVLAFKNLRNAALEEAAKVAEDGIMYGRGDYDAGYDRACDDIAQAIRKMKTASDPLLDMPGNGKEGV